MSVIGSMIRPVADSTLKDPALWLLDALGGRETTSGERINPEKSLTLSAYYACIRSISEDIAKLPFMVYRALSPRGKERVRDHPVYPLLHHAPNDEMTAMSFRETMTHWAMGWGGGVAEIERTERGIPAALWPIHPSRVEIRRDASRSIIYVVRSDDITPSRNRSVAVILQPRDVLHIHGLGVDGLHGYSIAQLARESIGLGMAAQRFGSSFFGHGATMGVVLEHPGQLQPTAIDNLRRSWSEMHEGAQNAYKTVILEQGMKANQTSIPPEQAQFLQTRYFQVEDIARWFRMPPHKIQHLLRSTFSNIEAQAIEYVGDTLVPWLVRWEQESKRKLFRPDEVDLFAEHVIQALLRGDQKARSEFYSKQFAVGALSSNDIREKENENPVLGGDQYFVPMNLRPIDQPPAASGNGVRSNGTARRTEAHDAFIGLFMDGADRVMAKACRATARAAGKYDTDDAFREWASRFRSEQETYMVTVFAPVAESFFAVLSGVASGSTHRRLYDALGTAAAEAAAEWFMFAVEELSRPNAETAVRAWRDTNLAGLAARMLEAVMGIIPGGQNE